VQEGLLLFSYREKGKENKMWGLPDSAVVGTVKRVKRSVKKATHTRHHPRRVVRTTTTKTTTMHRELTVSEWLELLQHAE
jgi:hypothetical protein